MCWMEQLAMDIISKRIVKKIEDIKTLLMWTINTTPDTLLTWDIDMFIGLLIKNKAPTLGCLLQATFQMKHTKENNRIKLYTTIFIHLIFSEIH